MRIVFGLMAVTALGLGLNGCVAVDAATTVAGAATTVAGTAVDVGSSAVSGAAHTVAGSSSDDQDSGGD